MGGGRARERGRVSARAQRRRRRRTRGETRTHSCAESTTTVARDGEELDDGRLARRDVGLLLEEGVDEEQVARGLELGVAEAAERLVGVAVTTAADEPARRLGAEVDLQGDEEEVSDPSVLEQGEARRCAPEP